MRFLTFFVFPLLFSTAYAEDSFQMVTEPSWFDIVQEKIFIGSEVENLAYSFDIEESYKLYQENEKRMVCSPVIEEVMYCIEPMLLISAKRSLDSDNISKKESYEEKQAGIEINSSWGPWDIPGMRQCKDRYDAVTTNAANCFKKALEVSVKEQEKAWDIMYSLKPKCEPTVQFEPYTPEHRKATLEKAECLKEVMEKALPKLWFPDLWRNVLAASLKNVTDYRDEKITYEELLSRTEELEAELSRKIDSAGEAFKRELKSYVNENSADPEQDFIEYLETLDRGMEEVCSKYGRLPGFVRDCWGYR